MLGLNSGTAKLITEITEDRIIVTHHPCRFVSVYVDPRQDAPAMDKEGDWIKIRILENERARKILKEIDNYCIGKSTIDVIELIKLGVHVLK